VNGSNLLTAVFCTSVAFFVGLLVGNIFPGLSTEPLKLLVELGVAVGTIGAVIVALGQTRAARREAASRARREAAESILHHAVADFVGNRDGNGRPVNDRRHWLNFARAVQVTQRLASKIELEEQREIWLESEHLVREQMYDILQPLGESYPADYYGHMSDAEFIKNFAQSPGDRAPISEPSLITVYDWVRWPEGRADPLDRQLKFTDDQLERMELFGPRGLARFITKLRQYGRHEQTPHK
jgi:hypothetical protein